MKLNWTQPVVEIFRQLLRKMVGGWSLERKSLLFLGVALVIPIGMAFWFVLQVVAEDLVIKTTQQSARDYARSVIAWQHVDKRSFRGADLGVPGDNAYLFPSAALTILREHLVYNPNYSHEFLTLDEVNHHVWLEKSDLPRTDREAKLLEDLRVRFLDQVAKSKALENGPTPENGAGSSNLELDARQPTNRTANDATGRGASASPLATAPGNSLPNSPLNNSMLNTSLNSAGYLGQFDPANALFEDAGPIFPEANSAGKNALNKTPSDGWYEYYHVVQFPEKCLECHSHSQETSTSQIPFRVVKVMVPYQQTKVGSPTTLAIMIAIAMVTVVATLFVVHWVLRRLVLNPLQHLKNVSDEISRGNTDLRANIDTGDEFNELADAFNRMLRHMTEGQELLRSLNKELDVRVDQLAQANLKLYQGNRLKSDFLANMSHELRTPLNSIIGFSDVLQDISSLTDKQKRYALNIQKSGKLLLEMINDILDLAKVEAGKMNVTPTSFDLPNLVDAQCDMLRTLADEKNMDLRTEFAPDLEPVFQDQPKLQQILTNLLSNAIKFTPDGGLVTVKVEPISEQHFHLTVEDTGVGIPEADFEVIFEKFRQSDAVLQNDGLTRQFSGTGLGLSIVKELCKLLGGEVRLTSQLGTGSTFHVILPWHYNSNQSSPTEVTGLLRP
jgi:two-component system, NarL family, sensor histidine kinase BarA